MCHLDPSPRLADRVCARLRLPAGSAAGVDHVVEGVFKLGGQEHFYLEPNNCCAIPGENDEMTLYSSTQVRRPGGALWGGRWWLAGGGKGGECSAAQPGQAG